MVTRSWVGRGYFLLILAGFVVSVSCRPRPTSSEVMASNNSSRHIIPAKDAVRQLLTYGASEGLFNGKQDDGKNCKLNTESGGPSNPYERYSVSIHERKGFVTGALIKNVVLQKSAIVEFEKIEQDQPGGSGNKRWFHRYIVKDGAQEFTLEECIYQGLSDFDLAIIENGVRTSCNKRFGPLIGWSACRE